MLPMIALGYICWFVAFFAGLSMNNGENSVFGPLLCYSLFLAIGEALMDNFAIFFVGYLLKDISQPMGISIQNFIWGISNLFLPLIFGFIAKNETTFQGIGHIIFGLFVFLLSFGLI